MFTPHRYGDTSPLPSDWLARIASVIARFWSRQRQGRHVRLMIAELQTFDDAMLKDIGVQRCRIESAVTAGGTNGTPRSPIRVVRKRRHRKRIARRPHVTRQNGPTTMMFDTLSLPARWTEASGRERERHVANLQA